MTGRRVGALVALALCVGCLVGAGQAGAAGGTTVLKFHDSSASPTAVGFDGNNPNAVPQIGAQIILRITLLNIGAQFGKPGGTAVGRVLLDCEVLAEGAHGPDGTCNGIAHVPNGYFTFAGNGGFSNNTITWFGITGGVGPYAHDRGEIKVENHSDGSSDAFVTLYG